MKSSQPRRCIQCGGELRDRYKGREKIYCGDNCREIYNTRKKAGEIK